MESSDLAESVLQYLNFEAFVGAQASEYRTAMWKTCKASSKAVRRHVAQNVGGGPTVFLPSASG